MRTISVTSATRVSLAAAVILSVVACNKQQPAADATAAPPTGPAVATVDGKAITKAEYDYFLKQITRGQPTPALTPEQKTEVINELVAMQVLAAQGAKDKVDADPEVAAGLEVNRMHLLADAEQQKFLKSKEPTDAELHDEYNKAIGALDKNEYHAHHILVDSKDLAAQLIKKIKAGAKFEDIAKAQSKDPGSKARGGDLDWFAPGRMAKPFADAVKGLKKGEMTAEPVETKFGWHIIRLDDTREIAPPPFEQVKEQLANHVKQTKMLAYIEELKKGAKVDVTAPVDASAASAAAAVPAPAAAPAASAAQ